MSTHEQLALLGGLRTILQEDTSLFHWPIVTAEDEQAILAGKLR